MCIYMHEYLEEIRFRLLLLQFSFIFESHLHLVADRCSGIDGKTF